MRISFAAYKYSLHYSTGKSKSEVPFRDIPCLYSNDHASVICIHAAYSCSIQVTKDHSLVEEMVRIGEIKREEARNHPDKNIITRALGAERTVDIDFFDLKMEPGSTILMCSDGLSNMVEDSKIEEIILNQNEELPQKGERLLREANQNGGKDNIAVILVEPFTNEVEKC